MLESSEMRASVAEPAKRAISPQKNEIVRVEREQRSLWQRFSIVVSYLFNQDATCLSFFAKMILLAQSLCRLMAASCWH